MGYMIAMGWILQLHKTNPTAQAIAVLAFVCVIGMTLGGIRVRGVKLGTAGVLFAGLLVGHFSNPIDHHTLEFVKEFGLILFVFCIGLQLGPGFFASFQQSGFRLNALALAIVLLGALVSVGFGWLLKLEYPAVLGIFSGATTNTPSLGAAQQTLASFPNMTDEQRALPALAYAVSYPFGIIGIIGTLLALRRIFQIDVAAEAAAFAEQGSRGTPSLVRQVLIVENPNLQRMTIGELPGLRESGVVVSEVRHVGDASVLPATNQTRVQIGDRLQVIGTAEGVAQFQRIVGAMSVEPLHDEEGPIQRERIVVTNKKIPGQTVRMVQQEMLQGVVLTTVVRGEIEMVAVPDLPIRFGDVLQVVGTPPDIKRAAKKLGNSVHALNETHFVPLFAGIGVGILLGTLPIPCPGLPQPLKLGLAAGPLIVAILVGRVGRIGRLVWHMPRNANLAFRELGIALFFAAVGLLAGPTFFSAACSWAGMQWLLVGLCVTVLQLVIVGAFARLMLLMNYVELCGLIAGSMTDPPALAFANSVCGSESPSVGYAAVYPLTMLLRIMTAQTLAVILCG